MQTNKWFHNHELVLELFVMLNLAFLAFDVFIAHSVNAFAHWGEWVPVLFGIIGALSLLLALVFRSAKRWVGLGVGWCAVGIGIGGLLFHLESQFFVDFTIKSLVYTAPFAAPLAFCGLGLLLIMNRMVHGESIEWGKWVVFMTLGGFFGNFVLSLCDHAQNGFFKPSEWIPIFTSAIAVGFLMTALLQSINFPFLKVCIAILIVNSFVGIFGFYLHLSVDLQSAELTMRDKLIYGPPLFAPLLFTDLALLGMLGIWNLARKVARNSIVKKNTTVHWRDKPIFIEDNLPIIQRK